MGDDYASNLKRSSDGVYGEGVINAGKYIKIDEASRLLDSQSLPAETFREAVSSDRIKIHEFKDGKYVDRLDIGRIYHRAPEKREGLTIERHFTDGVQDPFSTVEYAPRDLQIPDYRTGKVVFSMREAIFPKSWDDTDAQIVAQKYFYRPYEGRWKAKLEDRLGRDHEHSPVHLIRRVTNFIADEGEKLGYFKTEEDKKAFADELKWLQIHRKVAFNSPVQFNFGLHHEYGIEGSPGINYWRNPETGEVVKIIEGCNIRPQGHACFIKGPSDNLESIAMHSVDEIGIFSSGSGVGHDIGVLRGKGEPLSGGGQASGPLSFWKFYDDLGGTIKSGGKSRRAARMTTMRYQHPDIMAFIRSKVREDRKALTLMKAGYSGGMDGEAYTTVTFQNTNISVRLDDHFFELLAKGGEVELRRITDGQLVGKVPADRMLKEIAFGSWRIGDPAVQYESEIQEMHTCKNSGRINSSNPCSEYMFLDDTSCNLASFNLLAFCNEKGDFDIEGFKRACKLVSIALDINNDIASYPVKEVAEISPQFRTIGVGYANLGALLMRRSVAYDSEEGRALAGAITALMTGSVYEASAEMAERLDTFTHFEFNRKPMLEVIERHRKNLDDIAWEHVPEDLKRAAYESWDYVVKRGNEVGFRNAQATVLAPTGTISFLMGCDTTGVEPVFRLRTYKNLAGGGNLTLTVDEVPNSLRNLGYNEQQIEEISEFIKEGNSVRGAPHVRPEHYSIFDTAAGNGSGESCIDFKGHVRMLSAVQPFVSGAVSKTNNLPEGATVKDIYDGYVLGHQLGLKALAVFRDNSKPISALSFGSKGVIELRRGEKEELPNRRDGLQCEVKIRGMNGETPIHVLVGEYPDGRPGQIGFWAYKAGSILKALLETHGIIASKALKRGVELEDVVSAWLGQQFEPSGLVTGHPYIKTALSPLDFAAKLLLLEYQGGVEYADDKEKLNVGDLWGAKNGAFETYRRRGIDDWDYNKIMASLELGGFVQGEGKKPDTKESKAQPNGKGNERGVVCNNCGNLMKQTSSNCYQCNVCGENLGGCGA